MIGSGLRAALTVAAVYGYFLLFAQFSFVELMRGAGLSLTMERSALGGMAFAGIISGFVVAFRSRRGEADHWLRTVLRVALCGACAMAVLSRWCPSQVSFILVAVLTGGVLGAATVALASLLPRFGGIGWAGLGTGLGYAVCNLPWVFAADPGIQAVIAAGLAAAGLVSVPTLDGSRTLWPVVQASPTWAMIVVFTSLVWLDSAAFFIIQHAAELKAGTWGDAHLWRNAFIHLGFGLLAGMALAFGRILTAVVTAFGLLALAALAVNDEATRQLGGWLYPAAVSLYSTALIVWPGWFSGAKDGPAVAFRAAWLFGVAGWFGSANGIGMAGRLQQVPAWFVAVAALVVVSLLWVRRAGWRSVVAVFVIPLLAVAWSELAPKSEGMDAVARGRAVYVAEGCLHCHSQYPRPETADEAVWGSAGPVERVTNQSPVLIGNRRQGPDLANIGARRSEAWLREHFMNPRNLSPDSVMPAYAHLFRDQRGSDLLAYLKNNGIDTLGERMTTAAAWRPADGRPADNGPTLYQNHCAVCHGTRGEGDGLLAGRFVKAPANLRQGPFVWTVDGPDLPLRVMRVIKFGIPGTDMPGHELLDDAAIRALGEQVILLREGSVRGSE